MNTADLKMLVCRDKLGEFLTRHGLTGQGVEVGTFWGTYAEILLKTWGGRLTCVDPWRNQPDSVYLDGANTQDMETVWKRVQQGIGKNPRCSLLRMMSLNGSGRFEDGVLDFVYLDGNHAVDYVRDDIMAWWPKVKIGGIVGGHDYFTRHDDESELDALTAVNELNDAIGIRPHVTWCTSWWFVKTEEADAAFRRACVAGKLVRPGYTDNTTLDLVVAIPVARFDWNLAKKLLTWMAAIPPDCPTVAYCTPELTDDQARQLKAVGPKDLIIAREDRVKEVGYFGSASQMFLGAAEFCEKNFPGRAMLFVEADAVPMRAGWATAIRDEYRACGRPFMGDFIRAWDVPHMSGNAVYHPNWRNIAPDLARCCLPNLTGWDASCAHQTLSRAHLSRTIQQIWRPPLPITEQYARAKIRESTALFHQCKDGSMIDVLCTREHCPVIPLEKPLCESTYLTQPRNHLFNTIAEAQPSVAILIVTYAKDIEFLRFCLRSIEKYTTGFAGVTVVVPRAEMGLYDWISPQIRMCYFQEEAGKGMLHHEVQKCRADEWIPGVDFIMHLDADCMFWKPAKPSDYLIRGRALMVRERYDAITGYAVAGRKNWRIGVEAALGFKPEFETMVRHPQVYPRGIYSAVRKAVEAHTGMAFDDYVLSGRNEFPPSFGEFDTIGAIAIRDFPSRFHFVDYDRAADCSRFGVDPALVQYLYRRDRDFLIEFWSHGGIEKYRAAAEQFLLPPDPGMIDVMTPTLSVLRTSSAQKTVDSVVAAEPLKNLNKNASIPQSSSALWKALRKGK